MKNFLQIEYMKVLLLDEVGSKLIGSFMTSVNLISSTLYYCET